MLTLQPRGLRYEHTQSRAVPETRTGNADLQMYIVVHSIECGTQVDGYEGRHFLSFHSCLNVIYDPQLGRLT
ncbi:hypothetical protein DPMN_129900 [Dreissena polymorpha]|uniref:Uncharacterized protein n=1 Tax=Dreissena polymorpha TaxID=45954 RepID=A0A9D4H6Q1_DREPO|nr:hypothetical protein DPMN_129900 [Dreissena polymorpha]